MHCRKLSNKCRLDSMEHISVSPLDLYWECLLLLPALYMTTEVSLFIKFVVHLLMELSQVASSSHNRDQSVLV